MHKRNRLWLPLIGVMILGLVLAACQQATPEPTEEPAAEEPTEEPAAEEPTEEPEEEEPVALAVFHPVLGNTYTQAVSEGVTDAAEPMGATVEIFGADPAFDPVAQSNQIQDAIISGQYDAFLIYAVDGNAVATDVEDAIEAGIEVIAVDVVIGPDPRATEPWNGITSYIGRTGYDHGTFLADMMIRACEEVEDTPCQIGYLNGAQSLTIDQERVAAIEDSLADHDDIEIVAMQDANYLQDQGYDVAQNMLQANADIDVLATSGDQMMLGAEQAVIDADLEGEIILIGNGVGERGYEAIEEGRFFCGYADIPYTMGQLAGEIAVNAVRGEEVPSYVDNAEQSPPLPPGGPLICQDNVDQFEPQW
jgi:ribose transport system substrate-binding protein